MYHLCARFQARCLGDGYRRSDISSRMKPLGKRAYYVVSSNASANYSAYDSLVEGRGDYPTWYVACRSRDSRGVVSRLSRCVKFYKFAGRFIYECWVAVLAVFFKAAVAFFNILPSIRFGRHSSTDAIT